MKGVLVFEKKTMKTEIRGGNNGWRLGRVQEFVKAIVREECEEWVAFQAEKMVDVGDRLGKFIEEEREKKEYEDNGEEEGERYEVDRR